MKTTLEWQKLLYHIIFLTLQIFICATVVYMQLTCSIVYLLQVTILFSAQHRAAVERYFTSAQ